MEMISSLIYTIIIGAVFIFIFRKVYDLFYGEKKEKQIQKIHNYYRNENIIKVDLLEHQPKIFTLYKVKTDKETKKVKIKPGYKVVKIVPKKN
nr:hypothetical protein [Neobacillus sp. Marseille-Q6967]